MIQVKKRTYLISLSLAAGLALSQLTGCASSGPEETTAAESTQAPSEAETASIPNPMEEVENEQSFESMGIHMVAPADGEHTKSYPISGEVAEITFDERFTDLELAVNWESGKIAGQAQVKTTESGGRLASWSWGSTRYTVYTASAISDEECTQVVTNLMELSYYE